MVVEPSDINKYPTSQAKEHDVDYRAGVVLRSGTASYSGNP
jgi:hypothetical protein